MRQRAVPIFERLRRGPRALRAQPCLRALVSFQRTLRLLRIAYFGNGAGIESGERTAISQTIRRPRRELGTVYAVCGCSGEGGYFGEFPSTAMATNLAGLGFMILNFNGLRLHAEFLQENGTVFDSFSIDKSQPATERPRLTVMRAGKGGKAFSLAHVPSGLRSRDVDGDGDKCSVAIQREHRAHGWNAATSSVSVSKARTVSSG